MLCETWKRIKRTYNSTFFFPDTLYTLPNIPQSAGSGSDWKQQQLSHEVAGHLKSQSAVGGC